MRAAEKMPENRAIAVIYVGNGSDCGNFICIGPIVFATLAYNEPDLVLIQIALERNAVNFNWVELG